MANGKKYSEKLAVGMFVEGQFLHVACLALHKKRIKLIDAKIVKMVKTLEAVKVQEPVLSDVFSEVSDSPAELDISEEIPDTHWVETDSTSDVHDNAEVIRKVLKKYPHRKNKLAITLSEPQIYYSYYGTDWGLDGKKLHQKILEDLVRERQNGEVIQPDALHVVRLKDGRLMGIVRDNEVNILNLLEFLRSEGSVRIPNISLVESAETSLANIVNVNYEFAEDEITVVVYLGNEFSRLIFMKGNEIYNISYIIGAGLDSENINNTIFSRILLEQDNLNLPRIQNIILTGEAYEVGLKAFLETKLPAEINVDYIKLNYLDVIGTEPLVSRFAVAIGAAWRILKQDDKYRYAVDLLPVSIRENQKKFKLGIAGWILLLMLPAFTVFSTVKIGQQVNRISQLKTEQQFQKEELAALQEVEMRVNAKKNQLSQYQHAFTVLDSMSTGLNKWNRFLYKLSKTAKQVKHMWITDLSTLSNHSVSLRGYSVYRSRIPVFSNAIGGGALKKVEVQEIRDRTVYNFEMDANLPDNQ